MSTLVIRKKSLKTWLHTDSILGDFIISKFYFNADGVKFQIVEQGQSKRVIYNVTDITLYNTIDGGGAETFSTITELSLRLEELNYPAFQYDGQITSIANLLEGGDGVVITGDGTEESPYIINLTSGDALFLGSYDSLIDLETAHPVALNGSYAFVNQMGADLVYFFSTEEDNWWTVTSTNAPNLNQVLTEGNQTDGENIVINNADAIELENGSLLKKGTYDFGANGGISRICSVNFEDNWQGGIRHVFDNSGFIRNSTNCFDIIPDASFDNTLRFKIDSLWTLDNGDTYKCTDASTGAAVWELVNTGSIPNLQQVTDALLNDGIAETTNGIKAGTCYMTVDGFFEGSEEGGIYFQIQNSEPSFVQIDEFGSYHYLTLRAPFPLTSSALVTFQATSGTVALLSDIPSPASFVPYTGATADVDLDTFSLNAKSLHVKGTGGAGHLGLKHQSSNITASASESSIGANSSGNPVWKNDGNAIQNVMLENSAITGATKTKITYDAKGLVTSGADATTADIADSTNKRYVTDAQQTVIGNTSGTNSGDNAVNSLYSGLASSKQDTLVSGTNIKTLEGQSLLGSGNIDLTKSDVGLGNVDNTSDANKPVSTATQTALNAKQDKVIKQGYTTLTGVTGTQVLASLLIPADWLASGDGIEIVVVPNKSTTASAVNFLLYHDTTVNGTTNAIATATSLTISQRMGYIQRIMSLNSTTLYNCLPVASTSLIPIAATGATPTTTFNPTVTNYITLTVNPTVGSEVTGFNQFFIRKL